MSLLFFAIIGALIGYRLHTTRAGYAAMAAVALAFPILQIILAVVVRDAESRTMLPLVVGLTLALPMVVGVIARSKFPARIV
jgi:chromate transport protein ChrA